ncbi:hypothetical protein [Nocardiopsis ansamitocini]|uniref:Uncharacterized protein n=1 Tax=Nocardiopsis ansamitocini TaxID=1670832 RepID=A0A9W6P9B8_9ACTN|nr:hypothetical protein [Nocardiopsis ansamitocini]GLU49994.1 hypothetical protein Nans01_43450 [Nocardiopsis ansamitocini]
MHPLLSVPLAYRLMLISAGPRAALVHRGGAFAVVPAHEVDPAGASWTVEDLLSIGVGALTVELVA